MRHLLAILAIALLTAGIHRSAPPQVCLTQTRVDVLCSVHASDSWPLMGVTARLVKSDNPNALILVDDVIVIDTRPGDSTITAFNHWRTDSLGGRIPAWGNPNNHDPDPRVGSAADPLSQFRKAYPEMDWYGNYAVTVGNIKFIFLNTMVESYAVQCSTATVDTLNGIRATSPTAAIQATIPQSMYSNFNSVTGPGYLFVQREAKSCTVPFLVVCAANGFYPTQGSGSTGDLFWNQSKAFLSMLESTTTALGFHVNMVISGHQHLYRRVLARGDSLIAYASGGIYHVNGPPRTISHSDTAKTPPDYVDGAVAPDTCPADSIQRWQVRHAMNGALLQKFDSWNAFSHYKRPGRMVLDASRTLMMCTVLDSTNVVADQFSMVAR